MTNSKYTHVFLIIPNVLKALIKLVPILNRDLNVSKRYIVAVGQYDMFLNRHRIDFTSNWAVKRKFVPIFYEKSRCL